MTEFEEQPVPDATCPYCGGTPTDESIARHKLGAIGYLHDDIKFECAECEEDWVHGVPVGEYDGAYAADLFCDACEERYQLVHRVVIQQHDDSVLIHLKCPNCYHFEKLHRELDDHNVALMGYPQITGDVALADGTYGYTEDSDI